MRTLNSIKTTIVASAVAGGRPNGPNMRDLMRKTIRVMTAEPEEFAETGKEKTPVRSELIFYIDKFLRQDKVAASLRSFIDKYRPEHAYIINLEFDRSLNHPIRNTLIN